ncbi:MAG: winged helix-turn-helix transcriptional regulator [Methanoregula sp.]|jgi:predicted transcriptional regulator|uniref:winged helix-turn-helix transcriptional regulator n=1 Tax=Methanoregula sp. TaxID=2052170 RepID=UPI0025F51103|nr:winged helix-turn-helix transcriptional regulator [Methanoregula sp.]MCK9631620.1 winged helix-turn-helix transcriptional regulator [Methanoregula sp.]
MKGRVLFAILLIFSLLYLFHALLPPNIEMNGYVVEPVPPGTDPATLGEPVEMEQVEFWDLPPKIMLMSIIPAIPFIKFPAELIFAASICLFFGFRIIARHNIFDSAVRKRVYTCIRENPGISFMALARDTEIKPGTLRYHLALMKMTGKITLLETYGHTRYFENSGKYPELEQKILKYLKKPTERTIFDLILKNPCVSRKDLEEQLGISGSSVTWHMNRLANDGLITVDKIGKSSQYVIEPEAAGYLKKYLAPPHEEIPHPVPDCG